MPPARTDGAIAGTSTQSSDPAPGIDPTPVSPDPQNGNTGSPPSDARKAGYNLRPRTIPGNGVARREKLPPSC